MSAIAASAEVERFRTVIARRLGLQFGDARSGFLGELLGRRIHHSGGQAQTYLDRLNAAPQRAEIAALARELTVGETYFFRHREQFLALRETVLPDRMRANARARSLHLLSAGCASGEEAYSLAMLMRDGVAEPGWDIAIRAVDLNPAALAKARRARYSPWALRETPPELRARWFSTVGNELLLDESVRDTVCFVASNLAEDDAAVWRPACFDVVLCRNVLMYFAPAAARALIARIAGTLRPGGYLFLGHAETLRGLSDDFDLRHSHGTFYYQLGGAAARRARRTEPEAAARDSASGGIAAMTAPGPVQRADPGAPASDLRPIFDLLHRERFGEALARVRALPPSAGTAPEVLLLDALLLAHQGRLAAAETACRRLLASDGRNAGAHYLLALCRDSAGDSSGAAEHDRTAIRLDPGFAMPRLHLGLLARRAGAHAEARRALGDAAILLEHEDISRVLLFGGGFRRDALVALCRSALRDCGGEQ